MEIKQGYKRTEIGVIPEDWQIRTLERLTIKIGSGITPTGGEKVYKDEGRPFVRSQNIGWGNLLLEDIRFIDDEIHNTFISTEIKLKDVFLNITGASIGRSSVADNRLVGGNVNQHVCIIRTKGELLDPYFLNYFLLSKNGQKQVDSFQSGGNRQGLNFGQISTFQIPLPLNLIEQTAIATALSDADALIASLEKLIAKKRNIKQGAMQELLKPKEGWEVKTLKEVAKYRRGSFPQPYGLDKWYDDNLGMPFVQVYDVDDNFKLKSETKRKISKEAQKMSVFIEKGSIILTIQGSIGRIAVTQYDAYVDRTLLLFESFSVPFDKYFFLLSIFLIFEMEKEKAPGGIIKTITKEALSSFTISYPSLEEQSRIATILTDINEEIFALETKLAKYRAIKQGMMQNLLTGKIRLI
jgi:type I restriction enzyme S subunit